MQVYPFYVIILLFFGNYTGFGGLFTETVVVESPEYFQKFRCKCGECRSVCCRGWRISLSEAEYFRLMGLSCGAELRRALDEAFAVAGEPSEERYAYIAPDAQGSCRVLDEDGWCRLHRECGEGVQPAVCRLYPRSIKPGEVTEACCSGSCEAVIEALMALDHPLRFVTKELQVSAPRPDCEPADKAKDDRRRHCIALLQQPGEPLAERIRRIGAFLGVREEADDALLLHRALLLLTELGAGSLSLRELAVTVPRKLGAQSGVSGEVLARFLEMEAQARRALPESERWLEQSLVNHMYYAQFPYAGDGISPLAAYDGLCGAYVLLRLLTAFARDEVSFADLTAAAFRYIEHTDFYRNAHIVLRGHK